MAAARLLDRPRGGQPPHVLAKAEVAVHLHHLRLVAVAFRLTGRPRPAAVDPVAVLADADEAVGRMPALVGQHQRLRHHLGDVRRRALGAQDRGDVAAQRSDADGDHVKAVRAGTAGTVTQPVSRRWRHRIGSICAQVRNRPRVAGGRSAAMAARSLPRL